jgi:hypothetical protein
MSFRHKKIEEFPSYFSTGHHKTEQSLVVFGPHLLYLCAWLLL